MTEIINCMCGHIYDNSVFAHTCKEDGSWADYARDNSDIVRSSSPPMNKNFDELRMGMSPEHQKLANERTAAMLTEETKKLVYVSSPLGAPTREGVLENYRKAAYACYLLLQEGFAPIAGHLFYPLLLDEHKPSDRELGILCDMTLLDKSDRVVFFTPDGTTDTMSSGMKKDWERLQIFFKEHGDKLYEFRPLPEIPEKWAPSWLFPRL